MGKHKFVPFLSAEHDNVEEDYTDARRFEDVLMGSRFLFFSSVGRITYLPIGEIAWGYLRRENKFCSIGCRRAFVPKPFLVLVLSTGQEKKIAFEDDAHVTGILDGLKEANADLLTGYTEELRARFDGDRGKRE